MNTIHTAAFTPARLLVVKVGTGSLLFQEQLSAQRFHLVAEGIARLMDEGVKCILVTSGAIRAGKEILGKRAKGLKDKNISAIGGRYLFDRWAEAFRLYGDIEIAPLLVTYANWRSRKERQNLQKAVIEYAQHGILSVINENDVISDEEVRSLEKGISDNDKLAAMIAELVRADSVMFWTEAGGVFTGNSGGVGGRYREIDAQNPPNFGSELRSSVGRGGIKAKVTQAIKCFKRNMRVSIAGIHSDANGIFRFGMGESVGTMIGQRNVF